jgi:hypothetical protein
MRLPRDTMRYDALGRDGTGWGYRVMMLAVGVGHRSLAAMDGFNAP